MNNKFGLRKLPKDLRDFKVGKVFTLPVLAALPDELEVDKINKIKNQGNTDFCSAYASCYASEFQEKIELLPEWNFAASKRISGDPDAWGQNLRDAMKAHVKYGAIEKKEADIPDNPRYLKNWPYELVFAGQKHKKRSYLSVVGQHDYFDDIRATLYMFSQKNVAVVLGLLWDYPLSQKKIEKPADSGYGHAVCAYGWKGDYLKIINSYGKEAGENGTYLVHKDVINANVKRFGSYIFVDMDPEHLKKYKWNLLQKVVNFIKKIIFN